MMVNNPLRPYFVGGVTIGGVDPLNSHEDRKSIPKGRYIFLLTIGRGFPAEEKNKSIGQCQPKVGSITPRTNTADSGFRKLSRYFWARAKPPPQYLPPAEGTSCGVSMQESATCQAYERAQALTKLFQQITSSAARQQVVCQTR